VKLVLALLLGMLVNAAVYIYLQQQPLPNVAEAPQKNSELIVVHTP